MKVFGVTVIPRHNVAAAGTNTGWNDAKTAIRREVNQWIRTRARFDGVSISMPSCATRRTPI